MSDKTISRREESLHRFIDGVLGEDEKLDLLDSLAEDPAEAQRVEEYERHNHMLRALRRGLDVGDAREFCPDLQAQIVEQLHKPTLWRRPAVMALAASLAIGVIASGLYVGFDQKPIAKARPETVVGSVTGDDMAAEALPDGLISVGDWYFPFSDELAAHSEMMMPDQPLDWFNGHMSGRSISKPDLSGHGLELVDVNVWSEKPKPALHLSYRDQAGKPVELYAGILSEKMHSAFGLVAEGHISIHWRMGDLVFALVAPSDSPQLHNIVSTVSAAVETVKAEEMPVVVEDMVVRDDQPLLEQAELPVQIYDGILVPVPKPLRVEESLAVEPPQALPPPADGEEQPAPL